jgi:hypothetical protein
VEKRSRKIYFYTEKSKSRVPRFRGAGSKVGEKEKTKSKKITGEFSYADFADPRSRGFA